jgi:glycosyltransferase involved in cell wall biosynthesis/O-antigen/teichoic acid export membrane protein
MEPGLARVGAPRPEIRPEGAGEALVDPAEAGRGPLHILVLTDREWTHPQGGGTGTNLFGQVMRWLAWGHRVTVIACGYAGSLPVEHLGDLTIHRIGGRSTVFPRAIWRQWRGLVPDADVVLEVINGITFLTPIWLRTPRVVLIHHIHRRHYVAELGRLGAVAALMLETAPLRWLYRDARFLCVSNATADDVAAHGIPRTGIAVNYNGVELDAFTPGPKSHEPTLLFLGRIKRYKRIELILDALAELPRGTLHIAGDGDYRPAVEEAIAQRGLKDRVVVHGAVDEPTKLRLLQSAWIHVTASACEGWGLTVTEAAACRTPTVAIAGGGLSESVVDGETGLLVQDAAAMARALEALIADQEIRERLADGALGRTRALTWERTARATLGALEEARARGTTARRALRERVTASDTMQASTLALAVMVANVVQLIFTIVFARLLGGAGYGELAALLSAFLILSVPGSALQITVAREVSIARADGTEAPAAAIRRWLNRLLVITAGVLVASVLLRDTFAAVLNVNSPWAAAAVLPAACGWLLLSVQRGALQGYQRYGLVAGSLLAEAGGRLLLGLLLWGVGLGVAGAFYGTAVSVVAMVCVLGVYLHRQLPRRALDRTDEPRLRMLVARTGVPVLALALLAVLQNVDVIVVRHSVSHDDAGPYAAASVSAKGIIWVAIGLGMYLLPEAARRTRMGLDARPILIRTIVLVTVISVPLLIVFALAAKPLLTFVYGSDLAGASGALPLLGMAMTLLACAYLSVQYLLALGRASFLWLLAVAAIAEPVLLVGVGSHLVGVALALLAIQALVAVSVVALSLRWRRTAVGAVA